MAHNITCPNCRKSFEIDENGYAALLRQVRGEEFDRELALARQTIQAEMEAKQRELEEKHAGEIRKMEDVIAQYRDFKIRLDNKSLGESLEQFCLHEFEKIRGLLSADVTFEKDNEARKGETKGDFIYRETDGNGVEILSIMFEMKTEFDDSSNKKKNSDHFAKLDRDRKNKGCEYAVLVTMLEADNEYYNQGIVRAPGSFEKMYVVRPQCFLTIISILRSAAMSSLSLKEQIAALEREQADVTQFEKNLADFKAGFATSVEHATDNFNSAIQEIDKVIVSLQRVRDTLLVNSAKQLNTAVGKADKLTIKKLTKNTPAVSKLFAEIALGEE